MFYFEIKMNKLKILKILLHEPPLDPNEYH
jgi:hypothetical protein